MIDFSIQLHESKNNFRRYVLKLLNDIFEFQHMTFLMAKGNYELQDPVGFNIESNLVKMYSDYYFETDIFYPLKTLNIIDKKNVLTISDIMTLKTYESTEYYNDFLKRQGLYYEAALPLKSNNRLLGGIGVFRPREQGDFTPREKMLLSRLNEIISVEFNDYLEKNNIKIQHQIYKNCSLNSPLGLIVLDSNYSIVDFNDTAINYCKELLKKESPFKAIEKVVRWLTTEHSFKAKPGTHVTYIYKPYIFKVYSVTISGSENMQLYFYIYISELIKRKSITMQLTEQTQLTKREKEIVNLILQGLTNSEIADRLFISIHTVKTHIENIFKKMKVNSRTELLSTLLSLK